MTAKELIEELEKNGGHSTLGRLIVKAVLAKLPRILTASLSDSGLRLTLADGRELDLSPDAVEALADAPLDSLTVKVNDVQSR